MFLSIFVGNHATLTSGEVSSLSLGSTLSANDCSCCGSAGEQACLISMDKKLKAILNKQVDVPTFTGAT